MLDRGKEGRGRGVEGGETRRKVSCCLLESLLGTALSRLTSCLVKMVAGGKLSAWEGSQRRGGGVDSGCKLSAWEESQRRGGVTEEGRGVDSGCMGGSQA